MLIYSYLRDIQEVAGQTDNPYMGIWLYIVYIYMPIYGHFSLVSDLHVRIHPQPQWQFLPRPQFHQRLGFLPQCAPAVRPLYVALVLNSPSSACQLSIVPHAFLCNSLCPVHHLEKLTPTRTDLVSLYFASGCVLLLPTLRLRTIRCRCWSQRGETIGAAVENRTDAVNLPAHHRSATTRLGRKHDCGYGELDRRNIYRGVADCV